MCTKTDKLIDYAMLILLYDNNNVGVVIWYMFLVVDGVRVGVVHLVDTMVSKQ